MLRFFYLKFLRTRHNINCRLSVGPSTITVESGAFTVSSTIGTVRKLNIVIDWFWLIFLLPGSVSLKRIRIRLAKMKRIRIRNTVFYKNIFLRNMICFVIYGVNIYANKHKFNSFEKNVWYSNYFCLVLLKFSMILADSLLLGSGSGWPKWNGSKRIRIRNTACFLFQAETGDKGQQLDQEVEKDVFKPSPRFSSGTPSWFACPVKWPDKSTTSYDILDFKSYVKNL